MPEGVKKQISPGIRSLEETPLEVKYDTPNR